MSVSNPWLNPLQRSYQQIKTKLIEDLRGIKDDKGNTLITDYSEGNILIMIISMFSAIAEVLHYYIDNMGRETFFSTARRYDSLVKHGTLVDYRVKGAVAPTVDVVLSRPLSSNYLSAEVLIIKGWEFGDTSGRPWEVVKDTVWNSNTTEVVVPLIQHQVHTEVGLINYVIPNIRVEKSPLKIKVPSLNNKTYYEHGTMSLEINGESWTWVDTFAFSGRFDKHFTTEVDFNMDVYIKFGDGLNGLIPDPGSTITDCSYYVTYGVSANIEPSQITVVPRVISSIVLDATCSNPYKAGGGSSYEDFEMLKEHIPLHVRTLGVAITKQDFVDIAMLVEGVNKAAAEYECGKKLNIYITPDNGTIASSTLIDRVYNKLKDCAPLTTWLRVKSAGLTEICLDIDVTGRKSFSKSEIQTQIRQALLDKYSIEKSEIGGQVRISDIYALIDNLPSVDYLHINKFYVKPWPTIIYGNSSLIIDQFIVDYLNGSMIYYIIFTSTTQFEVRSKAGNFSTQGVVGSALTVLDGSNHNKFTLAIVANGYQATYRYTIQVSEPNVDYIEPGYNLPIFQDTNNLNLTVNEVL